MFCHDFLLNIFGLCGFIPAVSLFPCFSLLARTHGIRVFSQPSSTKNTAQPLGYAVFLVEATGIEGVTPFLNTFILKGLRHAFPVVPQKLLFLPNVIILAL